MTTAIIDIAIAAILLVFLLIGGKRGFFRSLAGLASVILTLIGASIAAKSLAPVAAEHLSPVIEEKMTAYLEQRMAGGGGSGSLLSGIRQYAVNKVEAAMAATMESMLESLLYGLIFLAAVLILALLLFLLFRAADLAMKLPVLNGANAFFGGLIGLIEGMLIVWLILFLAPKLGYAPTEETLENTCLLQFFATVSPLELLSFL